MMKEVVPTKKEKINKVSYSIKQGYGTHFAFYL